MENSHVLVVHSEAAVRQLAAACLERDRIRVSLADGDEEGLSLLEKDASTCWWRPSMRWDAARSSCAAPPPSNRCWESSSDRSRPAEPGRPARRTAPSSILPNR